MHRPPATTDGFDRTSAFLLTKIADELNTLEVVRTDVETNPTRLDEDVYECIEARKRPTETFSDAVARLDRRSPNADLDELLCSGDVEAVREAVDADGGGTNRF